MNASDGLLKQCEGDLADLIPRPLEFTRDDSGHYHFASGFPRRTVIDVASGIFSWIKVEGRTILIALDGTTVIYERVSYGPHAEWICVLRSVSNAGAH